MKKVSLFLILCAASLCAVLSCRKEAGLPEGGSGENVSSVEGYAWHFTASFERPVNPGTRVADMDENGCFAWENGDEIKILWEGGNGTAAASVSEGVASFAPEGLPEEGTAIWLVYPSAMTAALEDGALVIGLPSVQKNSLAGFFVAKAAVGDKTVAFRHPVCYYKIVVEGDGTDVTRMVLSSVAGNFLASQSLSLDFDSEGIPSATAIGGAASVTVDFQGEGTYYFPLVPGVSPAANDLTFQFYRGEGGAEKAGAYRHGEEIVNARSTILGWGNLPAKATNRYVSVEAGGTDDGSSSEKSWDFVQFKKFMEKAYMEDDEPALFDGLKVHFAAGTYNTSTITPAIDIKVNVLGEGAESTILDAQGNTQFYNHTSVASALTFKNLTFRNAKHPTDNGACFRVKNASVSFENCSFTGNTAPTSGKGGGVANAWGTSSLSFRNCTFTGNYGTYGGVLYIQGTTAATIESCSFTGNGSGNGGAFYLSGQATLDCTDCTFGNGTEAGRNYANQGGVLYINNSNTVSFTNCLFDYNQGSANWGSCIMMYNSSTVNPRLFLNACIFRNNVGLTRGVVAAQNSANALIYMNAVTFCNNSFTDTSNAGWGLAVHCGNSVVCMNNVTAFDNHPGSTSKNWVVFNSDGGWLITNSTVVNDAPLAVVRANSSARRSSLCNNIFINTSESEKMFEFAKVQTSGGHNVMSRSSAYANFTADNSDKTAVVSLSGGAYSEPVYTWTNNLEGFVAADQAAVKAVYDAYDETVGTVSHVGNDYYAWLESIGALDKDGRGEVRTGNWWPGSYQNN